MSKAKICLAVAVAITVIAIIISFSTVYTLYPWAHEGNWILYKVHVSGTPSIIERLQVLGTHLKKISVDMTINVTIVNVGHSGFTVVMEIKNISSPVLREAKELGTLLGFAKTQYYYQFDKSFSPCDLYVSPDHLPRSGVLEGNIPFRYTCRYDIYTGWLKEAHIVIGNMSVFIKAIETNFPEHVVIHEFIATALAVVAIISIALCIYFYRKRAE